MATFVEEEEETLDIGKLAGRVWHFLEKYETASSVDLKKKLAIKNSELFMALGWLARENKVDIEKENGFYYFKLINK